MNWNCRACQNNCLHEEGEYYGMYKDASAQALPNLRPSQWELVPGISLTQGSIALWESTVDSVWVVVDNIPFDSWCEDWLCWAWWQLELDLGGPSSRLWREYGVDVEWILKTGKMEICLDLDKKFVKHEDDFASWVLHHLAFHRQEGGNKITLRSWYYNAVSFLSS